MARQMNVRLMLAGHLPTRCAAVFANVLACFANRFTSTSAFAYQQGTLQHTP